MKQILILLFLFFSLLGCTSQEEKQANQLLEELELKQENQLYLIIPNSGCGGCISDAENFALNNMDNPNLKVIFTAFSSKKNLRIHLGKSFYHQNTVIDSNSYVQTNGLLSIYPVALLVENGNLKEKIDFAPTTENAGFNCANFLKSLE